MRLIDVDRLKSTIKMSDLRNFEKMALCSAITSAPPVDAVPVIRCKDCKNYRQSPYSAEDNIWCMCWSDWLPTEPDDFCSYGERKEGAKNE